MKVYEAIARAIEAEGCKHIFGLMGDGNMWLWATLAKRSNIQFHSSRHENSAVAMADGYARHTGEIGVATVTHGPGFAQTAAALITANRNRTPLVLIVGDFPSTGSRLQWMDQSSFAKSCESSFVSISSPKNAINEVAAAFQLARSRRGPVVLNLPMEIQEADLPQELVGWRYAEPVVEAAIPPDEKALASLAEAMLAAERPIIIAGRGVMRSKARDEIVRLADRLGALLSTTLMAKDLFLGQPYNIGLAGGYTNAVAEKLFKEADFVLCVGASLSYYTANGGQLFPNAKVGRIDNDVPPQNGSPNVLYVQGDARLTVDRLLSFLNRGTEIRPGYRTSNTDEWIHRPAPATAGCDDGLDLRSVMRRVSRNLPDGTMVSSGAGHFLSTVAAYLTVPPGGEFNTPVQFGAIGQALGMAMGICIAEPERPHLLVEGDGSLLMELQELETVVRCELPLTILICNDSGYGAEVHKLNWKGFDGQQARWTSPDFVEVARALGGDGVRITSEDALDDAILRGFKSQKLFVIDAQISPTQLSDNYQKQYNKKPNVTPLFG
jgi:acetolactate synthase I/II/III large subunit